MLSINFIEHSPHIEGFRILIDSATNNFASLGADDIIHEVNISTNDAVSHQLKNSQKLDITAFAMHPTIHNFFAMGASNGVVKFLKASNQLNLSSAEIIFKGDRPIRSLNFNESGELLGITTDEELPIIYCLNNKRLYKLSTAHEGFVINIFFGRNSHIATLGAEGNLHLYSIQMSGEQESNEEDQQQNPFAEPTFSVKFQFIDKCRFTVESISRNHPYLKSSFAYFILNYIETTVLLIPGQIFLQEISIEHGKSHYRIQRRIQEQKQILQTEVLNMGGNGKALSIITTTESILSIWNYSKCQKIVFFDTGQLFSGKVTCLRRLNSLDNPSFILVINNVESDGKIYQFKNFSILDIEERGPETAVQEIEQQKIQDKNIVKKNKRIPFESIAKKLIPEYPQQLLQKSYEQYLQARFLFYNSIGCVIERINHDNSQLELQLHDKTRPNRLKIKDSNRKFDMFALREKVFVYASSNLLVFQQEKQLKEGYQGWEMRWENIKAIAIGANWVAAINDQQIKVLDYAGNQIHTICFDRKVVTMEAYEDLLVVVYHHNLPMWDCQNLKMRIYNVTVIRSYLVKDAIIPMKFQSRIKWFGFSEQGMIFCQDTLEMLRCYKFDKDEWQVVLSLQDKSERLYIQHIEGTDAYGFRLEQKQGELEQPKVLPRSLPRKIPLQIPDFKISFLSNDEILYLKRIILKNLTISHENFRWQMWYKYKYSRRKGHPELCNIKTIQSEEQIKTLKMEVDIQLYDYVKKFASRLESKGELNSKAVQSLLLICERESHYEQTKQKIKQILVTKNRVLLPSSFDEMTYLVSKRNSNCKTKINQISILEQMLSNMSKAQ